MNHHHYPALTLNPVTESISDLMMFPSSSSSSLPTTDAMALLESTQQQHSHNQNYNSHENSQILEDNDSLMNNDINEQHDFKQRQKIEIIDYEGISNLDKSQAILDHQNRTSDNGADEQEDEEFDDDNDTVIDDNDEITILVDNPHSSGKSNLYYKGSVYFEEKRRLNRVNWKCVKYRKGGKCPGRLSTDQNYRVKTANSNHNHPFYGRLEDYEEEQKILLGVAGCKRTAQRRSTPGSGRVNKRNKLNLSAPSNHQINPQTPNHNHVFIKQQPESNHQKTSYNDAEIPSSIPNGINSSFKHRICSSSLPSSMPQDPFQAEMAIQQSKLRLLEKIKAIVNECCDTGAQIDAFASYCEQFRTIAQAFRPK